MTCSRMPSCSLAPRESASVNVSISLWTVCDPWGRTNGGLHVPLGKLYTERLVPVDEHVRQVVTRILALRALAPPSHLLHSASFLLPRSAGPISLYQNLRQALHQVAGRAGCSH